MRLKNQNNGHYSKLSQNFIRDERQNRPLMISMEKKMLDCSIHGLKPLSVTHGYHFSYNNNYNFLLEISL